MPVYQANELDTKGIIVEPHLSGHLSGPYYIYWQVNHFVVQVLEMLIGSFTTVRISQV